MTNYDNQLREDSHKLNELAKPLLHTLSNQLIRQDPTKQHVRALIPGAGAFPSYPALLDTLAALYPNLKTLALVLVDPWQQALDAFSRTYPTPLQPTSSRPFQETRIFHCETLAEFIRKSSTSPKFDLVYMEHPPVSAFYCCFFSNTRSLRWSLPLLSTVLASGANIMAVCQTTEETRQAEKLLRSSFNLSATTTLARVTSNKPFIPLLSSIFPSYYGNGVVASNVQPLNQEQAQKQAYTIKISDYLFCLFTALSAALYVLTNYVFRRHYNNGFLIGTASFSLLPPQLLVYQPNLTGVLTQLAFVVLQLAICANQLFSIQHHSDLSQNDVAQPSLTMGMR